MLDRAVMPISERLLGHPARALFRRGVTANQVTFAGFAIGLSAVPALAFDQYFVALVLILVNRLADGLDGAIARIAGPTSRGAYFDIALDFFFYSSIPFGFALANPGSNALPAAFVLLSFVGTGSSFLAFATIAAK
ncbi:MAG: CDP-alcohol phosphatidyltransferase family protein, partial [Devosia sp.]|nr:CDP-alcohol phosphatidyltransferase family protein [Devosia sp.]